MAFGVTAATVSAYANGLAFSDGAAGPPVVPPTQPSLAQVTTYIAEAGQIVAAMLWRKLQVTPAQLTSSAYADTYAVCARMVALDAASWALAARGRLGDGLARDLRERYDAARDELLADRTLLGSGRATGDTAAQLARGPQSPSDIRANGVRTGAGAGFFNGSDGQL
jgi:hypothetical protein